MEYMYHDEFRQPKAHDLPEDAVLLPGLRFVGLHQVQNIGPDASRLSVAIPVHPNPADAAHDVRHHAPLLTPSLESVRTHVNPQGTRVPVSTVFLTTVLQLHLF